MEKDKDILKQVGRDTGMRVPDGYFESFTSRMVSQLDNFEVVEPEKPTVWQRVRPWLYMAAMFAGIALMVRLFVPEKRSSSVVAETEVSITNENVEDYLFYSNVDEYSVYEYLELGEKNNYCIFIFRFDFACMQSARHFSGRSLQEFSNL